MRTFIHTLAEALDQPGVKPIFLVSFEGVPYRFASGTVTSQLGTTYPYVSKFSGDSPQITPDEGKSSAGSFGFALLDFAPPAVGLPLVTQMLARYTIANAVTTVKLGAAGVPESDYATVYQGRITDYSLGEDGLTWDFSVSGIYRDSNQSITFERRRTWS